MNGYYDINLHKTIIPYVTAGVGIARNKAGDFVSLDTITLKGKTNTSFVWNVGAGVKYNLNRNFALDLSYRYIDLGSIKTDNLDANTHGGKQKIKGHQAMIYIIYSL